MSHAITIGHSSSRAGRPGRLAGPAEGGGEEMYAEKRCGEMEMYAENGYDKMLMYAENPYGKT